MRWGTLHAGIDLAAPHAAPPSTPPMDGVVLKAGPASGFGLAVYIQHANGDVTVYGHMEKILVQDGQVVKAGDDDRAARQPRARPPARTCTSRCTSAASTGQKIDPLPWLRERGVAI